MTTATEYRLCSCCKKYKAYKSGLCWGCHNEVANIEREFSHFGDEDIGHGRVQQERIEKDWK